MNINLLTKHHFEFLSFKGGCTGLSASIYVKIPHCLEPHAAAQIQFSRLFISYQSFKPFLFMTSSANRNLFHYHETEQPCARGQHKHQRNSVYKQSGLYILHTKSELLVRGHLAPLCMFFVTSKTKQHPWLFPL